jgi:SpoVK/Ycf46/Vps4 family AAA+-type ATPase
MARIFRPRLMVYGEPGMGQHYIGSAVLHYLEGFHVQTFDIGNLLSDSARTPETAVVQMLAEVKRHTPSVIFLPNVEVFFETMSDYAKSALLSFLRNLGSSEEIMLLGIVESEYSEIDPQIKMLFGYSGENSQQLHKPSSSALSEFFKQILDYLKAKPTDYPDYENRPKRKLEALEIAPPPKEHVPTKSELRERELNDKKLKNTLKVKLGPLMDIFKNRYKRFKKPPIDDGLLIHLFEPPVEGVQHEYVKSDDDMILEVASGKKYFNIDLDIIEERLWNGFYSEPKQFLHDIEMIHLDAQTSGDRDRGVKASEMYANAQVAIDEIGDAQFLAQCHDLRKRELVKLKELQQERQQKLQKEIEQQQQQQQQADQVQHENRELNDAPEQAGNHENHEQQQQLQMQAQVEPLNLEALEENGNAPEFSPIKDVQAEEVPKVAVDVPADTQESTTENISLPNGSATNGGTDISIADKDGDSVMNEVQPPPTSDPNEDEHSSEKGNSKDEEVFEAPQREKEYFIPPSPSPGPEPENPDKEIILDTNKMDSFYTRLVDSTKGLTIEQLEQVNSALIDTLWSQRHLWDRNKIIDDLENTLTQVVDSIHAANKKASMEAAHVTGMY